MSDTARLRIDGEESAAADTEVDQTFAANLPLNGRSFNPPKPRPPNSACQGRALLGKSSEKGSVE